VLIKIQVVWDMTPCLVVVTNVSEEFAACIFSIQAVLRFLDTHCEGCVRAHDWLFNSVNVLGELVWCAEGKCIHITQQDNKL
jgi:hypothetical protein